MAPSRFCTQCGTQLRSGARFCSQCGVPVRPTSVPADDVAAPPVASAGEEAGWGRSGAASGGHLRGEEPIVDIIVGVRRPNGLLGARADAYALVLTPARLILAQLDAITTKAYVQRARAEAKAEGKGLFRQWGAQLVWTSLLAQDLRAMRPDQILTHYPGSFQITVSAISRVRIRQQTDPDYDAATQLLIIIDTTAGTHRLRIPTTVTNHRDLKRRLAQVLPIRIR